MKRRLVAAAFDGRNESMRGPLALFERDICMREADANQEGHDTCDSLELADFDIVVGCTRARSDQQLLHAIVRNGTHDPGCACRYGN